MKLFQPIMQFLPTAMDNMSGETFYSQPVVEYLMDMLAQIIDQGKNAEFLLQGPGFKIYETMMLILNHNEYLELAGKACLLLSHFLWNSKKA
jgi:hypothetical protein